MLGRSLLLLYHPRRSLQTVSHCEVYHQRQGLTLHILLTSNRTYPTSAVEYIGFEGDLLSISILSDGSEFCITSGFSVTLPSSLPASDMFVALSEDVDIPSSIVSPNP